MIRRFVNRGDTIIEVVLAITIFSVVAVSAIIIMNNGIAMSQRSLEITLVRQQIDAQAEMLRFVHDKARSEGASGPYSTLWDSILDHRTASPEQLLEVDSVSECLVSDSVTLAPSASAEGVKVLGGTSMVEPTTYARVGDSESHGISIQLTVAEGGSNAYDAYIQGCWNAPGASRPMTIGTIVRLYDAAA